jgi:GAF domain-containing protein
VIFVRGDHQVEMAATDPVVAELGALQMEFGDGPDVPVVSDRLSVVVSDTRTDTRWPTWAARASAMGIRSLVSSRMYTDQETIGTLSAYSEHPDAFDTDDQAVAQMLALHAAVALDNARKVERLWLAVDARKRIGEAQGILMERFDLSADQAFAVLVRYSQRNSVKLRAVADRLGETRQLPVLLPPAWANADSPAASVGQLSDVVSARSASQR